MSVPLPRASACARVAAALLVAAVWLAPAAPADAAAAVRKKRPAKPVPVAPVAPVAVPAPEPERDPWQSARALADAGAHDSALVVIRAALRDDAQAFDLRWLEAGITGESGRHADAVRLYEHLSADVPARADDVLGDLANERLWSDEPRAAAQDYRRWLLLHPEDRDAHRKLALAYAQSDSLQAALTHYDMLLASDSTDTESALGRARTLGWMGRHGQAMRAYGAVLAREPGNTDARLGMALNENWSGRHRHAAARFEALLREPGADAEWYKSLAFARYWDDDPVAARRAIERYLTSAPADSEALTLARRLAREQRPSVRLGYDRADDSDGLRVTAPSAEYTWPLNVCTTALFGWRRDDAMDAGGTRKLERYTAGLRQRFAPQWSAYANYAHAGWGDSVGTFAGGDVGVVNRPADRLRLEAAVGREPVFTRLALANGITLLTWVGAVDFAATDRLGLHADGRAGYYSDRNRSERASASARYRVWSARGAEAAVGLGLEQLNTHEDLDHGYYDPDFHREWGPSLQLEWRADARWVLGGETHTGWQRDKGAASEPYYNLSGRIEFSPDTAWTLTLEGGRGDSSLQSAGGYQRRWWQVSLARGL